MLPMSPVWENAKCVGGGCFGGTREVGGLGGIFSEWVSALGIVFSFDCEGRELAGEEMTMTLQNAMRQQQQHQQQDPGLAMFVRDQVKLDPTEHCPHVLTSQSEIMFSGVVDACGKPPTDTRETDEPSLPMISGSWAKA